MHTQKNDDPTPITAGVSKTVEKTEVDGVGFTKTTTTTVEKTGDGFFTRLGNLIRRNPGRSAVVISGGTALATMGTINFMRTGRVFPVDVNVDVTPLANQAGNAARAFTIL